MVVPYERLSGVLFNSCEGARLKDYTLVLVKIMPGYTAAFLGTDFREY